MTEFKHENAQASGLGKEKLYNSMTAIDDKFIEEADLEGAGEKASVEHLSVSEKTSGVNEESYEGAQSVRDGKPRSPRLVLRLGLGIAAVLAVAAAGIIFFTKILPENGAQDGTKEGTKASREEDSRAQSPQGGETRTTQIPGGEEKVTDWPTKVVSGDSEGGAPAPGPSQDEMAYVKRWDERTIDEKYSYLDHEGRTYTNRAVEVPADRKGKCLVADEVAYGWDPYAEGGDARRNLRTVVYEITGVSTEVAVAVSMIDEEGTYLRAFVVDPSGADTIHAATLGDLLTDWNLPEDLRIGTVYTYQDKNAWAQGYGTVCFDGADTAEVFKTLFKDTGAERLEELPAGTERILYSIAIYDNILGIRNLALSVYEGGYLWTNLTSYASIYKIDEADAQAFLDYVYAACEGYIPVCEKDPQIPENPEALTENAPLETVVESSKGRE